MLLKITSIDHDGYNGRDLHPNDSDIGKIGLVIGCDTACYNAEGDASLIETKPALTDEQRRAVAYAIDDPNAAVVETMWTIALPDGRKLEVMDHEVELFRS